MSTATNNPNKEIIQTNPLGHIGIDQHISLKIQPEYNRDYAAENIIRQDLLANGEDVIKILKQIMREKEP